MFFVSSAPQLSYADQYGPPITCCDHGPSIGEYKPFEKPIPNKPLKGLEQIGKDIGKATTSAWKVVKRPFVEGWKFLKDPFAGLRRKAERMYQKFVVEMTALAYRIVKWLSIGFGLALIFSVFVAMALAAIFRLRPARHAQ